VTNNVIISLIILKPKYQTARFARLEHVIQGSSSCVTAAASVLATLMIGHEIYSSTKLNNRARRRYSHIVEIMVQSAVIYTIASILGAITSLLDPGSVNGTNSARNSNLSRLDEAGLSVTGTSLILFILGRGRLHLFSYSSTFHGVPVSSLFSILLSLCFSQTVSFISSVLKRSLYFIIKPFRTGHNTKPR